MSTKITLKEISEAAGVSISTVSRVVNNHPNVSPRIRNRVNRVIENTGYQPNPAARSLAGGKSRIIGLVVPQTNHVLFRDPYFSTLISGIAEACNQSDYTLSLFLFHAIEDGAKIASRVIGRQVLDGLILTATTNDDPLVDQLSETDVPFVLVGRHENPTIHFVDTDNEAGGYTAVVHLIKQGCRRIATISGPMNNDAAVRRRMGYMRALRERGFPVHHELMVEADFTEPGGAYAMNQLLAHQPDAVFIASDTMARGAIDYLKERGIKVPEEVAIVGYDDLPLAARIDPPLTTIRQPVKRSGYTAVETLLDVFTHGLLPPRRIVLPIELVIRASCQIKKPHLEEDTV